MRLSEKEVIKAVIRELDLSTKIDLFGSLADPNKRGGDIGLLIFSQVLSNVDKLEEQKIDILIAKNTSDPFVRLALKTGIEL